MYTTGYSDHQLLCNLSIKLNSILTYTALAINSYKIWELVYEKRLLFHRGNMVYPPPPCSDSRLHGYTTASDPHEPLPSLPHRLIPLAHSYYSLSCLLELAYTSNALFS